MYIRRTLTFFLLGVIIAISSYAALGAVDACDFEASKGLAWLATGTVTKVDGTTFFLLGKDNVVYTIDAVRSEVLLEDFPKTCGGVNVGDSVRVFGSVIGECKIQAVRVRVYPSHDKPGAGPSPAAASPEKEIKIVIEKRDPAPPTTEPDSEVVTPAIWEGRGLVSAVDYGSGRLSIQTSSGAFRINVSNAVIISGDKRIGLGRVNAGDAVRITGSLVGLNEINARAVSIERNRFDAESAAPQMPLSVLGIIQQIDYPSMTFRMQTETSTLVISADKNTWVQQEHCRMAFMDLKPGMRVKMSGYGSLATGYSAQHIQIVSIAP